MLKAKPVYKIHRHGLKTFAILYIFEAANRIRRLYQIKELRNFSLFFQTLDEGVEDLPMGHKDHHLTTG